VFVISSEASRGSQFYSMVKTIKADSVHFIGKQGAFYKKL
jgi:hypothetical protein